MSEKEFTEQRTDYSAGRENAPELIVMVGISGSGKSVLAKSLVNQARGTLVRFNRDSIRAMLYCDVPWSSGNENLVRNWQMEGARQAIQCGKDALIDDTNCVRNTRQKWEEFAVTMRVKYRVITMTTPIEVCIERDSKRVGKECVGEHIIRKQQKDLTSFKMSDQTPKEPQKLTRPYFEREMLKNGGFLPRLPDAQWVFVDVDGTVATFMLPDGTILRGPFEEHRVSVDVPIEFVCEMVRALYPTHNICIVSGRHDFCGDDTCDWLTIVADVPFDHILMRHSGDNRSDAIVKKEILDEFVAVFGKEALAFVLDDRPRVVRMWRENGVRVIPVRGGTDHTPDCDYTKKKGYRECPDCGALEDF